MMGNHKKYNFKTASDEALINNYNMETTISDIPFDKTWRY